MIPLFHHYPRLQNTIPRHPLGKFPTPIRKLEIIGDLFHIKNLSIKNDGLSGLIFGGNKVRKLEFLLGEALRDKRSHCITFGCAGSNHALATALYAGALNMATTLLLLKQPNAHYVRKNLIRFFQAGASMHHYHTVEKMNAGFRYYRAKIKAHTGTEPFVIPAGGSSPAGTRGFVNAAFELAQQVKAGKLPEPDLCYVAGGTMGTGVGLAIGFLACGLKTQVVLCRVVNRRLLNTRKMHHLAVETAEILHRCDERFPRIENPATLPLRIDHSVFGDRYALFTRESVAAMHAMKLQEGIICDGTYTGKTLAALFHDARAGLLKNKTVLYWHTLNGREFSNPQDKWYYRRLPVAFHRYFTSPVQPLDRDA